MGRTYKSEEFRVTSPPLTSYKLSSSGGICQERSVEELYLACLLYYFFSGESQDRYYGFRYLRAVPDEALTDPTVRKIHRALREACGKGNGELSCSKEEFLSIFIDKLQATGGSVTSFAVYYGLAMSGELIPAMMLREFAQEIILLWKKRRIAEYQKLIAERPYDFETLKRIFDKIREIEEYDPIFEDQASKEEELLLAKAISIEGISKEIDWLYPEFIARGTINFWYAPPSQGKSVLALSVGLKLLREGKVDRVLYFDGDNPLVALKKRGLGGILEEYKNRLYYFRPGNAREFWEMLEKSKVVRGRLLIIVDTLQRLAGRLDINKTVNAVKIMDFFKEVVNDREDPATLIVLHHVNKPPVNGNGYSLIERLKGSSVFGDNCDVAYFFTKRNREDDALYVCLENSKDRIPVRGKINFKIEVERGWVEEVEEVLSDEEQRFVNTVVSFIRESYGLRERWPTQEDLLNHLRGEGYPFHRSRNLLRRWEGRYWVRSKDPDSPRGFIYALPSREIERLKFCNFEKGLDKNDSKLQNFGSNINNISTENLKFYKNVKSGNGGNGSSFENLKFCKIKEGQGKEGDGGSGGAEVKISKFQNFNSSVSPSGSGSLSESGEGSKISKFQNFKVRESGGGTRVGLPSKEEQAAVVEEYLRKHGKAPYEEVLESLRSADCRKCRHYDRGKGSCSRYFGQEVIPSLTARYCLHYEPSEGG